MNTYFAVIPDDSQRPVSLFRELEDAIDWGVYRYGSDRFRIASQSNLPVYGHDPDMKKQ